MHEEATGRSRFTWENSLQLLALELIRIQATGLKDGRLRPERRSNNGSMYHLLSIGVSSGEDRGYAFSSILPGVQEYGNRQVFNLRSLLHGQDRP